VLDAGVDAVISFGFAGGLAPDLESGDLVVTSSVVTGREEITCSAPDFVHVGAAVAARRLVSTATLIETPAEKARLRAATGADAVDMESAAAASVCARAKVPFLAIRAVLDTADCCVPLTSTELIDANGRVLGTRVALAVLRRPSLLGTLTRLGVAQRRAGAALESAARSLRAVQPGGQP